MSTLPSSLLIQYQYDALDCLASCMPREQLRQDLHYQKGRLATEIQGPAQRQIFQGVDVLLTEKYTGNAPHTSHLLTDKQRSVLQSTDGQSAYTPYGHRTVQGGFTSLLGFNGERPDTITGHYMLGNGHRAFNPVLMRFNSPDSLSPFGAGGLNCYAYCGGDPINRTDPTGRWYDWAWFGNAVLGFVGEYLAPLVPKSLARRIPGLAHPTIGRVSRRVADATGLTATGLYLVLNRTEAAFPDAVRFNDALFVTYLTVSAVQTVSAATRVLHKAVRALPPVPELTSVMSLREVPIAPRNMPGDLSPRSSQPPLNKGREINTNRAPSRDAASIRQAI
jgi:RHS repeat-associated protein